MVTRALADPSAISGSAVGCASSAAVMLCALAEGASTASGNKQSAANSARRIDKVQLRSGRKRSDLANAKRPVWQCVDLDPGRTQVDSKCDQNDRNQQADAGKQSDRGEGLIRRRGGGNSTHRNHRNFAHGTPL